MPDDNDGAPEGAPAKTFTQAELDKVVADRLARERAKYADYDELKAKAAKFDEVEAAGKSAAEKAEARAAEAERKAQAAEDRALRMEIAQAKGLTAAQAKRLVGASKEELEADADELLASFKPADPPNDGDPPSSSGAPGKPTEALRGGGDPTEEPSVDLRKAIADIPR